VEHLFISGDLPDYVPSSWDWNVGYAFIVLSPSQGWGVLLTLADLPNSDSRGKTTGYSLTSCQDINIPIYQKVDE